VLRKRVIGCYEHRPQTSIGEISRVNECGFFSVITDESANRLVEVGELIVPSSDGHIGDVNGRPRKRRASSQHTWRGSVVRGRYGDRIPEAAVLVASARRSRGAILARLAISSFVGRDETLVGMPVRLRVELRCIGTIVTVAECTAGSITPIQRLRPSTI
jgi:hypothetical protein